jgi:UDP-N-acetylenolpyruvoylglucosamine reductase
VLVNLTGKATPEEIMTLENKIISSVRERFGVELNPEVEHVPDTK